MQVSYGPPGHKGVTQLMAVGADEMEAYPTDRAVKIGGLIATGAWALGALTGNRALEHAGFGASIGFFLVELATGGFGRMVEVTQPAPGPATGRT